MSKKILFITLLLIACSILKGQTCIIARIENKRITVISDTKIARAVFGTNGGNYETSSIMKKIGGANGVYFAISGIETDKSFVVAQSLCERLSSLDSIVDEFIINRKIRLSEIAIDIKRKDLNRFENEVKYKERMQFLFFGFVKKSPKLIEIRLDVVEYLETISDIFPYDKRTIDTSNITVKKYTYPDDKPNIPATAIGYREDILDSLFLQETWKGEAEKIAERLLRKQASRAPTTVGLPFDLIILKRKKKINEYRIE